MRVDGTVAVSGVETATGRLLDMDRQGSVVSGCCISTHCLQLWQFRGSERSLDFFPKIVGDGVRLQL